MIIANKKNHKRSQETFKEFYGIPRLRCLLFSKQWFRQYWSIVNISQTLRAKFSWIMQWYNISSLEIQIKSNQQYELTSWRCKGYTIFLHWKFILFNQESAVSFSYQIWIIPKQHAKLSFVTSVIKWTYSNISASKFFQLD
jgi:hypothetical protein